MKVGRMKGNGRLRCQPGKIFSRSLRDLPGCCSDVERYLRIYSLGGAQRQIISLEGAPVSITGKDDCLAVVWHEAAPIGPAPGDQVLAYAMYNMRYSTQLARGRVALSSQSTLTYLGFSEDGMLLTNDSAGTVRVRTDAFGGSWTPIFRSSAARPQTVSTTGSFQHLRLPCIALSRRRVLDRPQVRVPLFITCRYLYRSSPRSSQLVTWRTKWRRQTLEWQLHRRPVKTLDWLWLRVKRLPSNSSIPHARVESSLAPQTLPKHSGSRTACELFSNFPLSASLCAC